MISGEGRVTSAKGKTVVYISGSWDLFHVGHLNALKQAKELGDFLVVGVSTDELTESYKKVKPVIPFAERRAIIESINIVDMVAQQSALMDIEILKSYKVDVAAIGDDWEGEYLEGLAWMEENGKVVYLPYTRHTSTTLIKRKIIGAAYDLIRAELEREFSIDLAAGELRKSEW
ncbi:MAG: adenylyltransferase/cytidyltransferase family protein [Alphaproteobacteria bacterium]|nr:adenylyltransferase/cytidyltransferase family protein [Alphaproteobacteria bacterium]